MSKNIIIISLIVIISILIGIMLITNSAWFSQEWLIGLGIVIGSAIAGGLFGYYKIKNR
ncbi:hypothetical protein [Nitrosopumilus oxyclinae]|uniref:hypothetical protein n=1 Tax=Nitrosopumilus oxyclinae TaxID=1959104 RepID=UPI0015CD081D|nr:hypothetical protein [Nitrosopumilus oxyclinae]